MCYVACEHGNGMGTFPQLRLTHLIPKERVTVRYLLTVFEGTTISNLLLAYKWEGRLPNRPLRPWGLISILRNLLTQQGIDRRMYLANVRAEVAAGRMIAASQTILEAGDLRLGAVLRLLPRLSSPRPCTLYLSSILIPPPRNAEA